MGIPIVRYVTFLTVVGSWGTEVATAQILTTGTASANCVHFNGSNAQGIPIPPTYYTVTGTGSATCLNGDTGSSAGGGAGIDGGLSVVASGFGNVGVYGVAKIAITSTLKSQISFPFDGMAHVTVTLTQRGVDDGGSNAESGSFSLNGIEMFSVSGGFSIPPGSRVKQWSFDVPIKAKTAIPYTAQVGVSITATYGTVQGSSAMTIDVSCTPTERNVMLWFFG